MCPIWYTKLFDLTESNLQNKMAVINSTNQPFKEAELRIGCF